MTRLQPSQIRNWQQISPNELLTANDKYRRRGISLLQVRMPEGHLEQWRDSLAASGYPHIVLQTGALTPCHCPSSPSTLCGRDWPSWF